MLDFIIGFLSGSLFVFLLMQVVKKMWQIRKERKIAEQKDLEKVISEFEKNRRLFSIEKNTLFGFNADDNFCGFTYSFVDRVVAKVDYVKVKIADVDIKKKHLYLCFDAADDYHVEVTSVIDTKHASGCASSLYGAIVFQHNLPDVQFGSKVLVRFIETDEGFEAIGLAK